MAELPIERADVVAVCVFPNGKKMLLLKQPAWTRFYLAACALFLIVLGLAATNWNWAALILVFAGAGLAYVVVLIYPQGLLNDPEKPHHWPTSRP
ncbi:DUF3379 domain-containing protein [Devosia naphthalenivorans]|uniref:DUF3379 domain-containing protein n=1 Tax=Devosia naphthalenivorans TaxID=2082392 RepID=UPI0013B06CCA|nr:DUF3379 domain-containing protein [Devosia naphthalenivorans]